MTKPDMLESFNLEPNGRHRGLAARCGPLGASREQSHQEPPRSSRRRARCRRATEASSTIDCVQAYPDTPDNLLAYPDTLRVLRPISG